MKGKSFIKLLTSISSSESEKKFVKASRPKIIDGKPVTLP